jgi:hypothetical protein
MFRGRLSFVRTAAVAAAGASCLAAAACGGITASSLSAVPVASRTPDPLASLTAYKVAVEALADLKAASSLTMAGTATQSGTSVTVNLRLKPGHGCAGTVGEGTEGLIKLVVIGTTVYFNPDTTFWKSTLGSEASTVTTLVNGRYIKTSTTSKGMASLASLCDLSRTMTSNALKTGEPVSKGAFTTLGGVRVLALKQSSDDSVVYVTDTSKPEIVEVFAPKGDPGGSAKLTFSIGAPVTLTAPPASQVLDGSAIGM